MSSNPTGQPGQANGPNGANAAAPGDKPLKKLPPHLLRRKKADPLVARKKPVQRPKPTTAQRSLISSENAGWGVTSFSLPSEASTINRVNAEEQAKKLAEFNAQRQANKGWTDAPPEGGYREFPVVTTKRALREGIRYHVMRFSKASKGGEEAAEIDPTNQEEFTRPVSLHRRDPRQPAPGRAAKEAEQAAAEVAAAPATADEEAAEKAAALKAERDAQRAIDMAQIAPVAAKEPTAKKSAQPQKKEKQIQLYFPKNSAEQKKETEIRYEEALPWHLEDADGKNVWVGTYMSALSEANVALVIDGSSFRMIPLEKFYRFTPKPPFKAYSIDQAEEIMGKKMSTSRWAMRDEEKRKEHELLAETRMYLNGRTRVKQESSTYRNAPRSEKTEHDDIDMEGDEFQDDDENVGLEPENDEDSKDRRDRIRRNHLGANLFGDADEKEVEKEEEEDKAARKTSQLGKKIRDALAKRESHIEYLEYVDSDSESEKDEYVVKWGDDEDDDEEKKKEEANGKEKEKEKPGTATGTPKGSTTPQGKKSAADAAGKKGKSLKRPGSPNLSESSGNESSRKKVKKHANGGSGSGSGSSVRPSRSSTPVPGQPRSKIIKSGSSTGGGALSDGEATAGEMSDGAASGTGGKKRIRIVGAGAARSTPSGSRASSPNPTAGGVASPGSPSGRAGSPGSPVSTSRAGSPVTGGSGNMDAQEIIAALRKIPEGITVGGLLKQFGSRIGDGPNQMKRKDWIKLVKENSVFGEDKLLRAKD